MLDNYESLSLKQPSSVDNSYNYALQYKKLDNLIHLGQGHHLGSSAAGASVLALGGAIGNNQGHSSRVSLPNHPLGVGAANSHSMSVQNSIQK